MTITHPRNIEETKIESFEDKHVLSIRIMKGMDGLMNIALFYLHRFGKVFKPNAII
jgi:hypothetical protein